MGEEISRPAGPGELAKHFSKRRPEDETDNDGEDNEPEATVGRHGARAR